MLAISCQTRVGILLPGTSLESLCGHDNQQFSHSAVTLQPSCQKLHHFGVWLSNPRRLVTLRVQFIVRVADAPNHNPVFSTEWEWYRQDRHSRRTVDQKAKDVSQSQLAKIPVHIEKYTEKCNSCILYPLVTTLTLLAVNAHRINETNTKYITGK